MFPSLPSDASSTLYVEGLPSDATEREVARIFSSFHLFFSIPFLKFSKDIFRPFPGYQSLRILTKESKQNPSRLYNLCFVEFDNKYQATFALNHLQGYFTN
jgi:RNA recognition motif-containing protein